MNNLKIALLLSLISFHSACSSADQDQLNETVDSTPTLFDVILDSGLKVENVGYEHRKITDDWVLQFRDFNNIQAKDADGLVYPGKGVSSRDFLHLVERGMQRISQEENFIIPSEIQVEFKFVEDIKSDIVDGIKNVARSKDGVIKLKERDVFFAVLHALEKSKTISQACEYLKKISLACGDPVIGLSQIAYSEDLLGKEWQSLLPLDDAGLVDGLWFSVKIKKVTNISTAPATTGTTLLE